MQTFIRQSTRTLLALLQSMLLYADLRFYKALTRDDTEYPHWRSMVIKQFIAPIQGSAAAADSLERQVPLVVDMTLRGVDMTLREKVLGGQNSGPWGFSGPGTFKKDSP